MRDASIVGAIRPLSIAAIAAACVLAAVPSLAQVPGEVQNVTWCAGAKDCLQWSSSGGATQYFIYRGEQSSVACLVNAPLDSCLESTFATNTTGSGAITENPAPGRFYWFLVTSDNASGEGPSGSARLAGAAQPRIRNTSGTCPSSCAAAGGVCSVSSDCCSAHCATPCAAQCCAPAGALCSQNSDCCSSMCSGGLCLQCLGLGQSCSSSATCCSGNCAGGVCVAPCQPNGAGCAGNGDCCSGVCTGGSCQPCLSTGGFCTTGSQCCSGTCTANQCQACEANGYSCVTGSQCCSGVCTGGQCVPLVCSPPYADCNMNPLDGCEINTSNDTQNCGNCGHICFTQNATSGCVSGACTVGTCNSGYANCNGLQSDGCEVYVNGDANNCGACGAACSSNNVPSPTCTFGTCNGACATGYADCDGNERTNGCEVNLTTSPTNCGGCGTVCSGNNIPTPTCASGTCNGTCATGFADCNGNKKVDGCETGIATDPANCGGCGVVCSSNHVPTPTCSSGTCSGLCAAGYADCNLNKQSDGCEVSIATDPNNCGACGIACSSNNIPTPTCSSGSCSGACATGFADCDNNKQSNGCEVNLNTNNNNCGSCGHVCPPATFCVSGGCFAP